MPCNKPQKILTSGVDPTQKIDMNKPYFLARMVKSMKFWLENTVTERTLEINETMFNVLWRIRDFYAEPKVTKDVIDIRIDEVFSLLITDN